MSFSMNIVTDAETKIATNRLVTEAIREISQLKEIADKNVTAIMDFSSELNKSESMQEEILKSIDSFGLQTIGISSKKLISSAKLYKNLYMV